MRTGSLHGPLGLFMALAGLGLFIGSGLAGLLLLLLRLVGAWRSCLGAALLALWPGWLDGRVGSMAFIRGKFSSSFGRHAVLCHGPLAVSSGVLPDLRMLTPEKHDQFVGILHGARIPDGMPSFAEAFDQKQMEQIHQYLIKRAHDRIEHGPNDLPQSTQKTASN